MLLWCHPSEDYGGGRVQDPDAGFPAVCGMLWPVLVWQPLLWCPSLNGEEGLIGPRKSGGRGSHEIEICLDGICGVSVHS